MVNRRKLSLLTLLLAVGVFLTATALAQHDEHGTTQADTDHGSTTQVESEHTDTDHGDAEHGDDHGGIPHLTNWLTIVTGLVQGKAAEPTPAASFLQRFLDPIFSAVGALALMLFFMRVYTRRSQEPTRLQAFVEIIMSSIYGLFETVLGPAARRYTPYLGTLFFFILINNLMGLLPLMHSSTSSLNTTLALGILTFLYVQSIALRENGIGGYLYHMAGSPRSGLEWGFVPLLFPLHLLGEFIKPISLSLRLFGNIFGEDTLIATMVVLGVAFMSLFNVNFVGFPFQFPFYFLAMLTSTIQALVFTLLSTVYIALMLPHEHEEHGGGEVAHGH
jgi:F-type H+-transporting ATPase subunit a